MEKWYYEVGSVFTVSFISGHPLDRSSLQNAVNAVLQKHQKLRMRPQIDQSTGQLSWQLVIKSEVQLVAHEIDSDDGDKWQQILVPLINQDFTYIDETEFRVQIIYTPTKSILLVGYPHILGDGMSGMILTNDLLKYYAQFENNETVIIEPLDTLADVETLSFPHGIDEASGRKISKLVETLKNDRVNWKPIIPYEKSDTQLRNIPYFYDQTTENFQLLLKKCHEQEVPMGSALIACLYFSVAKLIKKREIDFSIDIDVNLRNRLSSPLGLKDVGLLIGMIQLSLKIQHDTSFWQFAEIIHNQMTESLEEGNHLLYHPANRLFDWDNPEYLKNVESNNGLTSNLNFSNIGKFPYSSSYDTVNGQLQIDKMYCVGNKWVPIFGALLLLVSSVNSISLSLVVDDNEENKKTGLTFLKHFTSIMEKCSSFDLEFVLDDFINEK